MGSLKIYSPILKQVFILEPEDMSKLEKHSFEKLSICTAEYMKGSF